MKRDQLRILLIEDDDDDSVLIRDLISEIKQTKFEVTRVSTYTDGFRELTSYRYKVCLLDYRLGQHTGLELLAAVRDHEQPCPIIFLTGQGDAAVDIEAMEAGAADYLDKSQLTPEILGRTIRYTLKQADDLIRLQEQTNNFRVLFNSTFEGILVHENDLVLDANQASGEIFGLSPKELVGRKISSLLCFDEQRSLQNALEQSVKKRVEVRAYHQEQEIPIELSTREVSFRGRNVYLTTVQDLRERKQFEAQLLQQDRLASLGLLASSLAHEIGTPMGVIRGRAEMVALSSESESVKKPMAMIISQIDRITNLMNSVLQLARGQQTETILDVDVRAVLNDVLQLLNHEFQKRSVAIKVNLPASPIVRAEAGPLGQVFLNLLMNALHAIDDARKRSQSNADSVSIDATETGPMLELRIQDSGTGIPPKNLSSLFKPFFTTKPLGSGTGLGLAICYKILQSWGGSIHAESPAGSGAVFVLKIPRKT